MHYSTSWLSFNAVQSLDSNIYWRYITLAHVSIMLGFEPGRVAPDEFYKVRDKVLELGKEAKIWVGVGDGMEEEWGERTCRREGQLFGNGGGEGEKTRYFLKYTSVITWPSNGWWGHPLKWIPGTSSGNEFPSIYIYRYFKDIYIFTRLPSLVK